MRREYKQFSKRLFIALVLVVTFVKVDRMFYKRSGCFSERTLYSTLPSRPEWDLPPLQKEEEKLLEEIIQQPFTYLGKGTQCFAFASADGKYVIKFHKFRSHMRKFPWLTHPFSYHLTERRRKIKKYTIEKLDRNFQSYMNSYFDLKEETGLLFLHLNRTNTLKKRVTLRDQAGGIHQIRLDDASFMIQKRASLIYPTLEDAIETGDLLHGKQLISQLIALIVESEKKGYRNEDPVLKRNYGYLSDRAIHIDVGDLVKHIGEEQLIHSVTETTRPLLDFLEKKAPTLADHYLQEINSLSAEKTL